MVVLLATDGSEHARKAADHAVDLAAERGVPLHAICVVDERKFSDPALSSAELATVYAADHADLTVDEVLGMAAERGVTAHGETRHGVPHEVILGYADEVDASVIVVGEHGDHRAHLSGVGRSVSRRTDRDVVVVGATA